MSDNNVKLVSEMNVGTVDAGYRRLLDLLRTKGFRLKMVIPINHRRYLIVLGEPDNIMIVYKRDVFYNFGVQFREQGAIGVGDSINVDDLKVAMQRDVKRVYVIYPTGAVYTIMISDFLEKSFRWTNKEGKDVRSISIHEYNRVYTL